MLRHPIVQHLRRRNHPQREARLPCLVDQVERILRNTMPADPGPGIMSYETERLRRRRIDRLDKIYTQRFVQNRQLVDQRDVHISKHVLKHLSRLRNRRTTDRHNLRLKNRAVEVCAKPRRLRVHATDNLRNTLHTERSVPIINPLRRIDQSEIGSSFLSSPLKQRPKNLPSSPRIARALNNNQLVIGQPASQALRNRL